MQKRLNIIWLLTNVSQAVKYMQDIDTRSNENIILYWISCFYADKKDVWLEVFFKWIFNKLEQMQINPI